MRNPIEAFVVWELRRKLRRHGYTEAKVNAIINMYTRGKQPIKPMRLFSWEE